MQWYIDPVPLTDQIRITDIHIRITDNNFKIIDNHIGIIDKHRGKEYTKTHCRIASSFFIVGGTEIWHSPILLEQNTKNCGGRIPKFFQSNSVVCLESRSPF